MVAALAKLDGVVIPDHGCGEGLYVREFNAAFTPSVEVSDIERNGVATLMRISRTQRLPSGDGSYPAVDRFGSLVFLTR